MNTVCFAALETFVGCTTSCRNAAAVLGATWAIIPREGAIPDVVFDCDVLILSSWHERYEIVLGKRRGPIVPRWHSTVQQTEMGLEAGKLARIACLLDERRIPAIAICDPEFAGVLRRDGIVFLPDVLDASEYAGVTPCRFAGVNVSLFGDAHWRKNVFVQSAAFDLARRKAGASNWLLHLNGQTTSDESYRAWLQVARIPFAERGRMTRPQYLAAVGAMDVGLCAMVCESYCYVAADHVSLGVPVVASPTVVCLGDPALRAVRPDAVGEVADALLAALADREGLASRQRISLEEQARRNAELAAAGLSRVVARAERWIAP